MAFNSLAGRTRLPTDAKYESICAALMVYENRVYDRMRLYNPPCSPHLQFFTLRSGRSLMYQ